MMGIDPYTRRPAFTVPTQRSSGARPSKPARSADRVPERRYGALVPVSPVRDETSSSYSEPVAHTFGEVEDHCATAGIELQSRMSAPRRGLRADANEQARYHQAYADAAAPVAPYVGPKAQIRI